MKAALFYVIMAVVFVTVGYVVGRQQGFIAGMDHAGDLLFPTH